MVASPASYEWLSHSALATAGCVTVVAQATLAATGTTFGYAAEPAGAWSADQAWDRGEELGELGWFGAAEDATVVFEVNGFQGSRPEVLRPASKASGSGKAASIFWNVDGIVIVSCARRGKVVSSVELAGVEDELEQVPRSLRRLAGLCGDVDADLVAVGAAMVQQFTGVAFSPASLDGSSMHILTPPAEALSSTGADYAALLRDAAELVPMIVAAGPEVQRRLVAWATRAAADEAGVVTDPGVGSVLGQLEAGDVPVLGPVSTSLILRWKRESDTWGRDHESYTGSDSSGALEETFLFQRVWMGEVLKYSTHPDPLEAALVCVHAAAMVFTCTRIDRGLVFIEDESGRRRAPTERRVLRGRADDFLAIVARLLDAAPSRWPALVADLPTPFSDAERAEAIRADWERQEQGAFSTWQVRISPDEQVEDEQIVMIRRPDAGHP